MMLFGSSSTHVHLTVGSSGYLLVIVVLAVALGRS
jgi:hypothetical protein